MKIFSMIINNIISFSKKIKYYSFTIGNAFIYNNFSMNNSNIIKEFTIKKSKTIDKNIVKKNNSNIINEFTIKKSKTIDKCDENTDLNGYKFYENIESVHNLIYTNNNNFDEFKNSSCVYMLKKNLKNSLGACGFYMIVEDKERNEFFCKKNSNKNNKKCIKNEFNILKELKSKNISNIINSVCLYEIENDYYYFTPYYKRGDFVDYFNDKNTKKNNEFCFKIVFQMIDLIADLHRLGISHRDIKPDNFLLDNNGNLKLTDYGFSTFKKNSKDYVGTFDYISPELKNGEEYDCKKNDIYCLGITFKNIFLYNTDILLDFKKIKFYEFVTDINFKVGLIYILRKMLCPEKDRYSNGSKLTETSLYRYCKKHMK